MRTPATPRSAARFRKSRTSCGNSGRTEKANRQLLALLEQAQADPTRLMAAPTRLLDSQPALRRLKDGLVDAQLRTATLQGRMSAEHPEVISAKEAETQVAARLHGRTFHRDPRPGIGADASTPIAWKCWKTSETTRPPG